MIELVFVACLSAEPSVCETKAMQFSDISMMTCLLGAQPHLADWVGQHPGWGIESWTCQHRGSDRSA